MAIKGLAALDKGHQRQLEDEGRVLLPDPDTFPSILWFALKDLFLCASISRELFQSAKFCVYCVDCPLGTFKALGPRRSLRLFV